MYIISVRDLGGPIIIYKIIRLINNNIYVLYICIKKNLSLYN